MCVRVSNTQVCLDFYDLDVKPKKFTGCARAVVKLFEVKVLTVKLGCFTLKLPKLSEQNLNGIRYMEDFDETDQDY